MIAIQRDRNNSQQFSASSNRIYIDLVYVTVLYYLYIFNISSLHSHLVTTS